MHDLDYLYIQNIPADQQYDYITAFFDRADSRWRGFSTNAKEGSDQESHEMIDFALKNFDMSQHIREMLTDWRQNGF